MFMLLYAISCETTELHAQYFGVYTNDMVMHQSIDKGQYFFEVRHPCCM